MAAATKAMEARNMPTVIFFKDLGGDEWEGDSQEAMGKWAEGKHLKGVLFSHSQTKPIPP